MAKICFILILLLQCNAIFAKATHQSFSEPGNSKIPDTAIVNSYNAHAKQFNNVINLDSSYLYANKALELSRKIDYEEGVAQAEYNLGFYYFKLSLYKKSIVLFTSAKEGFYNHSDYQGVSQCDRQIGLIYYIQKKYEKAYNYFLGSLKHIDERTKPSAAGQLHYLAGLSLTESGKFIEGEKHLLKAQNLFEGTDKEKKFNECKVGLANLYTKKGNLATAENLYRDALNWFIMQDSETEGISICYLGLGNIEKERGNFETALVSANKAYSLADSVNFFLVAEKAAFLLSELYRQQQNYQQAFAFRERYYKIRDSIMSSDNLKAIYSMESELALSRKESEVELLNKQRQVDKVRFYSSLGGGGLLMLLLLGLYNRYRYQRRTNDIINKEKQHSDDLLLNILPAETAAELKKYGKAKAKRYEEVTVLFADIKGFTQHASALSPEKLVSIIDRYFQGFDEICEKYGMEKIKTIGDAYMAAGGLPNPEKGKPAEVVQAAFDMQEFVKKLHKEKDENEPAFEIRIGIHTGPVVAGVVGSKKFAYDIWGDTVNTAARMEQNSLPGKINISQKTFEKIKDYYNCTFRGKIAAKNKGDIEMYYVNAHQNEVHLQTIPEKA